MELKTNRGLVKYFFFNLFTFGIYGMYIIHAASVETNETCRDDGKRTRGFFLYLLLTILTIGIYHWVWYYSVIERWGKYIRKHNQTPRVSGGTFLLWQIIGAFLAGIGVFIAQYLFLHCWNDVNEIYNQESAPKKIESEAK